MKFRSSVMPLALSLFLGLGAAAPLSYLAVPVPAASAALQKISADGSYTMGDGIGESQKTAKIRARRDAMRMAAEKAGVYVESYSKTVNDVLTEDETSTISSTVLHVTKETYAYDDMGGQGMKITCHIEAEVDSVKIDEVLRQRRENSEEWKALQAQNKALRAQIEDVRKENKTLKASNQPALSAAEQQQILDIAKKKQEAVTAADWYHLGCEAGHAGQYEEAVKDFTEAIQLDASFLEAYSNRGASYNQLGQYEKAVKDYTEVIRMDPSNAEAYSYRGVAYACLGQQEKGIQDCTEAIRLAPSSADMYANRGFAYSHQWQTLPEAVQDCTEAIRLNPSYAQAYHTRGWAYKNLGQYQKAFQDAKRANELQPGIADELVQKMMKLFQIRELMKATSKS